jgi:hypothetical protein
MLKDHQHSPISSAYSTDLREQDAQYYRRVLHELIDIGVDIARMVQQDAEFLSEMSQNGKSIGPSPAPTPASNVAFGRVARATRLTITLARRLNEPVKSKATPQHRDRNAARKRIIHDVEDAI